MSNKRIYVGSGADNDFNNLISARDAARVYGPGTTVHVAPGIYRETLELDIRDRGISYIAAEGAVLTGGYEIPYDSTSPVSDDISKRFDVDALSHIRVIDLRTHGLTYDDWGPLCAIGAYQTSSRYDNAPLGENIEVFSGDKRMIFARYPNNGYLKLDAVLDCGECNEFPPQNYWTQNRTKRNPRGGCYIIDRETNERAKRWCEPETAWAFGYFFWDWADSSTPVRLDTVNRAFFPKYVSNFAARAGALYYFYNILEELDSPGEWYLDRENGLLYVYPYEDGDTITVSVSRKPLIKAEGLSDSVISGFTLTNTCTNGAELTGTNIIIERLKVSNVAGHGIVASGSRITVSRCHISHTGRGGVYLSGGDRKTLTPGECVVTDCLIHDFSEVYQTYQAGVCISGVGNTCSHCEIYNSPHEAITYGGNDIIIEYNNIHDVVTHSSDAGAIYAGYDWTAHGCVIRYNILRDIGGDGFHPDGIYWDDGLSGQSAYGNIIINVGKNSFLVGGGRDCVIRDNIIVSSATPISYDDRNRDGFVHGGWARQSCNTPESKHWENLRIMPTKSRVWAEKYPAISRYLTDFSMVDHPDFPVNPANSVVENNIIIHPEGKSLSLGRSVGDYSKIGKNPVYRTPEEAGFDLDTLNFVTKRDGFPEIPVSKIGIIAV